MALWKVEQAAEYLGIRPKTLYEWVRLGRVPYRKIGFNVRFDPDELEEWTESQSRGVRGGAGGAPGTDPKGSSAGGGAAATDELRRLAAEASRTLRDLERNLAASLSYPQRRRLSDLAESLERAVGSVDGEDSTTG